MLISIIWNKTDKTFWLLKKHASNSVDKDLKLTRHFFAIINTGGIWPNIAKHRLHMARFNDI